MAKEAFLPLFFGDFLASTAEWDGGEERALCLLLLGYQWSLGSLPADLRKLRKLADWDEGIFERCWKTVRTKFEERDGRLMNPRLEEHRQKAVALSQKNAASGRKGADVRWRNDGERHESGMANAIHGDGERHKSANGVTDGNPSHPIPSKNSEISSSSESPSLGGVGETSRKRSVEPRGSRLPQPFMLTTEMRTWAATEAPHVDLENATREFCDYWRSVPGQRGRKLDWVATWRNRMRECAGKTVTRNGSGPPRKSFTERMAALGDDA